MNLYSLQVAHNISLFQNMRMLELSKDMGQYERFCFSQETIAITPEFATARGGLRGIIPSGRLRGTIFHVALIN